VTHVTNDGSRLFSAATRHVVTESDEPFITVGHVTHTQSGKLPPEVYYAAIARKQMAAGVLCRDLSGHVLLVAPVYRTTWDFPGGIVEADESPYAACRREVAEEIGLDLAVGRVLAVDWVPGQSPVPEELVVIYDGGVLGKSEIDAIAVPKGELKGFKFFPPDEASLHARPVVQRRIHACLRALATGSMAELEDGNPIY